MATRATLEGADLPEQFRYNPPAPIRRQTNQKTAGGVVIHAATSIVAGDSIISWRVEGATEAEWHALRAYYENASHPDLTFVGYWGDQFEVKTLGLDPPEVNSTVFNISGSFQVVSVTSWGSV